MDLVCRWFRGNLGMVYFFYGLAFFLMGIAIAGQPKKESPYKFTRILWLFVVYGLIHAGADFLDAFSAAKGVTQTIYVSQTLTFISFLFLFEFSRRLLAFTRKLVSWWVLPALMSGILTIAILSKDFWTTANILIGYFVRSPAGVMAGLGLVFYYRTYKQELEPLKVKKYFYLTGAALLAWSFFCGLVRAKAGFFPASWLNTESFCLLVKIPVQVFRTLCAIITLIGFLGIFEFFRFRKETLRFLISLTISLFLVELGIMFAFNFILPPLKGLAESFLDAFILIILTYPLLFRLAFYPLLLESAQRREAEARTARLNSILRSITEINQLMVREKNQEELLKGACQSLLKTRGYYYVCIGLFKEEENRTLPVAQVSTDKDYLNAVTSICDSSSQFCPSQVVINTHNALVLRNIPSDPHFQDASRILVKHQVKTVASIPIILEERLFGVASVYSKDVDIFDDEEVRLLSELMTDIAFALQSIEVEAERVQIEEDLIGRKEELEKKHKELSRQQELMLSVLEDLETTQKALKELNFGLEQRVGERTADLEKANRATLNILEDLQLAKQTVEAYSKQLEQRAFELSVLYEVSNAISYTLDYQQLIRLIMEALIKIVDYDIGASLLFDSQNALITLKPIYPETTKFTEELKNSVLEAVQTLTGENIHSKRINVFLTPAQVDSKPKEPRAFKKLASSFNVPFSVRGKTIGLFSVSSCQENAFDQADITLIHTIVTQASVAVERLQAVITQEKSKMESMVESMAEGVIMLDERGQLAVLNPLARKMLSWGIEEAVTSRQLEEKLHLLNLDQVLKECQEKERLVSKEIVIPQEESQILRFDIAPVRDIFGKIIGTVLILRDITLEKTIETMKTEFVSTVSHELRTPLSIINEGINLVLDETAGKINIQQEKLLITSRKNIDRLSRLISDLLDISKIEAGKIELKRELANIVELIKGAAAAFATRIKEQNLELRMNLPQEKIELYIDADRLTQVFTNLFANALKFTKKGFLEIAVLDKEKVVEFTVRDTGIGIAPEDLPLVFSKFQQFARVAGAGEKGTGLGLSITKGIIELHKGKIWVDSKLGEGAKFSFSLPKYTYEELVKEYVYDGINVAVKKGARVSLIKLTLSNFMALKQLLPSDKLSSLLKDMEKLLKNTLRRAGDIAVKDTGEIFIFLAGCDKQNALRVEGRLEQLLEDYLRSQNLQDKVKVKLSCVTYPDEAQNGEELLTKV